MLKNKKPNFKPKKENVAVNMVLAVTTKSQIFEAYTFKEKEMKQNKIVASWQEKNNFSNHLMMLSDNYRRRSHHYNSQHMRSLRGCSQEQISTRRQRMPYRLIPV
jgi:hypothetical protein